MAKRVFSGTFFATSRAEVFVGRGPSDTVSYAKVETGLDIGDYTLGVFANLASGAGTFGWAQGDRYRGVENLTGSQHTDLITGNNKANILDGGGSPDFIYGRDGRDNILGGGGFDFLYGGDGNDVMNGQQQTDTMYGNDGHDQMWGGSNFVRRVVPGTNYADVLYGGAGNDRLHGDVRLPVNNAPSEYYEPLDLSPGSDELHGGTGRDTLNGDGGNDKLWGDSGADTFAFDAPYTVKDFAGADLLISSGDDVIMDFNPRKGDRLNFGGQDYTTKDTPDGIVIDLAGGSVTLSGIHTFSSGWVLS